MHTRVSKNPFLPPYHVLLEQGILTDTIILNIFSPCSFPMMIHAHKMERTLFYLVVAPGAFGINYGLDSKRKSTEGIPGIYAYIRPLKAVITTNLCCNGHAAKVRRRDIHHHVTLKSWHPQNHHPSSRSGHGSRAEFIYATITG